MSETRESLRSPGLIAFTGGGSAGHVTPNLAVIERWRELGGDAIYFGRAESVEEELLADVEGVAFFKVPSERLRRYFHWGNFVMPFIVVWGVIRAAWTLRTQRPQALFSKGGFVALPVVVGAWLNRIPVVIHESDGTLGLANRLSLPFTRIVCCAQARAQRGIKHDDVRVTGAPLRSAFFESSAERARANFNLTTSRSLLVIFGGSQGARRINEAVWGALEALTERYEVFHVTGPGHVSEEHSATFGASRGYQQHEYVSEGFADLLRCAHLVVGRAGANSVAELMALHKPALLIPLSTQSSRGDQALNAAEFVSAGGGQSLTNEELTPETLVEALEALESAYDQHVNTLNSLPTSDGGMRLIELLRELTLK